MPVRKVLYLFGQLSDDDVEWLAGIGTPLQVPAGATLIKERSSIDALYLVMEGMLSVSIGAGQGPEVARLGAGEIIGEISLVDGQRPSATVTALEDSLMFKLDRDKLVTKLNRDAGFAARFYLAIAIYLASRLRITTSQLGHGRQSTSVDGDMEGEGPDELQPNLLDNVHLAGARFDRLLKRINRGA